ncbi:transmembrane proteins 14C-domain-containing protein [Chaetomidium leptoderma]|uniref:Transmembrane proteins 14C-domain-containing protein n=1 Tax=Chaetomidium leptoderma TaxID=669021 RepID=A0AAN6VYH2_9PEZI|nr:transmembrane proteins 14C-domain-containing protein [Chaetomidium leptoderma]
MTKPISHPPPDGKVRTSKSSVSFENTSAATITNDDINTASDFQLQFKMGLEFPSYVLAALTATGGAIGFLRTNSKPSLIAGTAVGLLYGLGGYRIASNEPYGVELGLLASLVLGGSSFPRAIRLQKPVPIMLSLLAAYGLVTFGDAFRRAW